MFKQDQPGEHTFRMYVPVVSAGTDVKHPLMTCPYDMTLVDAKLVYQTAITGADTNTFTAKLLNGGATGAGTTLMASKAYTNGVDATVLSPDALTNSSTTANLNVSKDDVLVYLSDQAGSGLQDNAKIVELTFTAR